MASSTRCTLGRTPTELLRRRVRGAALAARARSKRCWRSASSNCSARATACSTFSETPVRFPPLEARVVVDVVCEVGWGLNGKRPKLARVLSDPSATVIGVEHRDRLARFGVEQLDAALAAQGRRMVVVDTGETADDVVRDTIELLTSMCARLYGRRGARHRALRAVTATSQQPQPAEAG